MADGRVMDAIRMTLEEDDTLRAAVLQAVPERAEPLRSKPVKVVVTSGPTMADASNADWLERANRLALTSALLSTTVHEVNNALQVISGSAEMINPSASPDVIGRRADAISQHARRASALLAELSSFGRDESTNTMPLDLGQIAQRALAMRQYTIAKLKLESSFESSGDARPAVANHRAVLQIVLNLVVNAEQALARKGSGRILLSLRGEGDQVALTVEDDGPGVAADVLPRLFEPMTLHADTRLGIGLAVAQSLARRFSGCIAYAPRPSGGSRFTLTLPAST
jgi:C4-dicarboxylate-specific signal transduction histidine kinase